MLDTYRIGRKVVVIYFLFGKERSMVDMGMMGGTLVIYGCIHTFVGGYWVVVMLLLENGWMYLYNTKYCCVCRTQIESFIYHYDFCIASYFFD